MNKFDLMSEAKQTQRAVDIQGREMVKMTSGRLKAMFPGTRSTWSECHDELCALKKS